MKSMTLTPDLVRERVLTHMCRRSGQFLMFYRPDEKNLVPYCMPNMLQGLPESLSFPDGLIKELKLDDNSIHSLRRVTHVIDSQSPEEQTCLIRIRYDRQPIWVQMRFFRNQTDDGRVYYIIVGENDRQSDDCQRTSARRASDDGVGGRYGFGRGQLHRHP